MKRSEAIDLLNNLIGVIEDNHNSDYDMALLIGIKAIEQEPFINKPCMSRGLCEHDKNVVLDKVKAEVDTQEEWLSQAGYNAYNVNVAFGAIKHVIGVGWNVEK